METAACDTFRRLLAPERQLNTISMTESAIEGREPIKHRMAGLIMLPENILKKIKRDER